MFTLAEQTVEIYARRLDPVALVEQHLERIDRLEPQLGAWVSVDREGALEQARRIAKEVATGTARGALLGAVVGVKDIVDVAAMPTRSGASWTDDSPAKSDAPLVAGLRCQGAIILGKTVTTELACFDPPNTRNPCNIDRTPGGSSSGSAVAVATQMCQLAVGSQTGGSITRPASFCGVMGLKPTFGAVPTLGVTAVSDHLDHPGPIARLVADLFDGFQAMRNRDEPWTGFADICRPLDTSPRLSCIDEYFRQQADDNVRTVYDQAVRRLDDGLDRPLGRASLPPSFADLHQMHRRLMVADAAHAHRDAWRQHADEFSTGIASLMEEGMAVDKWQYIEAAKHQLLFRNQILASFADADVLVTPATVTTAPTPETTGDPRFNSPWSYCGLPTISIPCGLADDGMPVGLQLIGKPSREAHLAAVAEWAQRQLVPRPGQDR